MRLPASLFLAAALVLGAPRAWCIPSASLDDDSSGPKAAPDAKAVSTYNDALALIKQGDGLEDQAAAASDAGQRAGALTAAKQAYSSARAKLRSLTAATPTLAEAWNSLGYTQRKLGSYDDALASYAKALELKPGYPEALEYRGEAYLRLNRINDAKQAYLDLFSSNRAIADHFLNAMKSWIQAKKRSPGATDPAITELDKWVQERSQIAAQTASLTRSGAAASWR